MLSLHCTTILAAFLMTSSVSATFFTQSPCNAPCGRGGGGGGGCGGAAGLHGDNYDYMHHVNVGGGGCPEPTLQPPCPVPPPPPVCPQHPPCPGAYGGSGSGPYESHAGQYESHTGQYASGGETTYAANGAGGQQQSYTDTVVDQFVQPLQQQQQYTQQQPQQQAQYQQPQQQPQYTPHQQQYAQAPPQYQQAQQQQYTQQYTQPGQYAQQQPQGQYAQAQYATDVSNVNPAAQPTVIYLDQLTGGKQPEAGKRPQVVYQSLPTGGSRLIVPPGSDVYALNSGAGASYQYDQPTVVYHTDQLPATGGYAVAAVEQDIDEMDLKGLEWGIPLKPTSQQRNAIDAIEKLADNADGEERILIRKARALADDVISREDQEEAGRDYGELINSDEEVETIGGGGGAVEGEEGEEELAPAPVKKAKKHLEKVKKSRRSSKRARAESDATQEAERDNDLDRKKCNSRRLYEIMLENMNESSAASKRSINSVAEAEFGTSIDVICSRGHFSYVFSSNLYCEASKGHVTCIAFRQAPPTPAEE